MEKKYWDLPEDGDYLDLSDEDYIRLFSGEAESEDLFEDPDLTPEQAALLNRLAPNALDVASLSNEEQLSWAELKAELNHWGKVFSMGGPDRAIAAEKIFGLFYGNMELYQSKMADMRNTHNKQDQDAYKRRFENADARLQQSYPGCNEYPVRFLKHIYPEELFLNAISSTLGVGLRKDGSLSTRCYDHTKGASYVTYFNTVLRSMVLSCKRDLWRENHRKQEALQEQKRYQQGAVANIRGHEKHLVTRARREALTLFAALTRDVLFCGRHLPDPDPNKKYDTVINSDMLQLYYTLQLVNYSRFDEVRDMKPAAVLMDAAQEGFLIFSTTTQDTDSYPALQKAELSPEVIEKDLYEEKDCRKILLDRSVAVYRHVKPNTVSKQFTNIRARLEVPLLQAYKNKEVSYQ